MAKSNLQPEPLYTSGEVAKIFGVDPRTVVRWEKEGKIKAFKTPSGQRRYRKSDVDKLPR